MISGPSLEKLGRGFFGHVYRLPLENRRVEDDLGEALKDVANENEEETVKANLRVARDDIWRKERVYKGS